MEWLLEHKFHLTCLAVIALEFIGIAWGLATLARHIPLLVIPVGLIVIPGSLVLYVITVNIIADMGRGW